MFHFRIYESFSDIYVKFSQMFDEVSVKFKFFFLAGISVARGRHFRFPGRKFYFLTVEISNILGKTSNIEDAASILELKHCFFNPLYLLNQF